MSTESQTQRKNSIVVLAFTVLGGIQLVIALFIVFAPGAFADTIGGFGTRNDHLARDGASFYVALGVGLLAAVRRPSWRRAVLLVALVQTGLHAVNHVLDVGDADPGWAGPVDVAILSATVAILAWLWVAASRAPTPARAA